MVKQKHRQRIRIMVGMPDLSPEQLEEMRKKIRKDAKVDAEKISGCQRQVAQKDREVWKFWRDIALP